MTTTSYCTRCGALVLRDELGTWSSVETYASATTASRQTVLSECCAATLEYHRPEADEAYHGPRDFDAEEAVYGYGEDAEPTEEWETPAPPSWFDDKAPADLDGFLGAAAGAGL